MVLIQVQPSPATGLCGAEFTGLPPWFGAITTAPDQRMEQRLADLRRNAALDYGVSA